MMNRKINFLSALILAGFVTVNIAHADDLQQEKKQDRQYYIDNYGTYRNPMMTPDQQEQQTSVSKDTASHEDKTIRDETFAISPQLGMLSYTNPNGAYSAKALAGVGLSYNFIPATAGNRDWYVGISTGALYSHNGSPSGNFFGANGDVPNQDNSNLIFIPADLKIGYNLTPDFRLSAHGGGNVIYRSVSSSVFLGDDTAGTDSSWKIYPDAGIDLEWQASKMVSILLRPDVTMTPGVDIFSATLGVNFINL